jgi:hypothetical protein
VGKNRLNIELFKKIRDRIASIPESYNQDNWWLPTQRSPCGTAACLAGTAIICNAPTVAEGVAQLKRLYRIDKYRAVPRNAAELLGLTGDWDAHIDHDDDEAAGETLMFDADAAYWPHPFGRMFYRGDEAEAAVAYLDYIIETGKVLE